MLEQPIVKHWLDKGLYLDKLLAEPLLGLALVEAFYSKDQWVTVTYLAERLCGQFSECTLRRRMKALDRAGRVECERVGRERRYRLVNPIAQKALAELLDFKCLPAGSALPANCGKN